LFLRSPVRAAMSTWAPGVVVPACVPLVSRTLHRMPHERCASVLLASKLRYWQEDSTVGCGLEWPSCPFVCSRASVQASARSGAHRDVLRRSEVLDLRELCGMFSYPSFLYSRQRPRLDSEVVPRKPP
jgi:hypothetical protein